MCIGYRLAGFLVHLADDDLPPLADVGRAYGNDSAVLRHVKEVLGRVEDTALRSLFLQQIPPLAVGHGCFAVSIFIGDDFPDPVSLVVVDAKYSPSQWAAGRGIGLIDFYITLFECVAERHHGRSAVGNGDGLAFRGIVTIGGVHFGYGEEDACGEFRRDLAGTVGGVGLVDAAAGDAELQTGHHAVLALLDNLDGSLCSTDAERIRLLVVHYPAEHFLPFTGGFLQHRKRADFMQLGQVLFQVDRRGVKRLGCRDGDRVAADGRRQAGGQGGRERAVRQHPVFIRQVALVGLAGPVPFQGKGLPRKAGEGIVLCHVR